MLLNKLTFNKNDSVLTVATCSHRFLMLPSKRMFLFNHQGLLECLIDLGQVTTALVHVNGVVTKRYVLALKTLYVVARGTKRY